MIEQAPALHIDDAYAISLAFLGHRLAAGEQVVGKKIGVTSKAVQDMLARTHTEVAPWSVVQADDKYRAKERQLNEQLAETEKKINELQAGKSAESALILSPEQKAEIERFQKSKVEIRKELRGVRRELDADIERLGTSLKVINILLVPLLVVLVALSFWWARRRRVAGAV